jgi:hypothetical protein
VQIYGKRLTVLAAKPFSASRVSHRFAPQPQQPPVFIAKKKRLKNLLHCSRLEPLVRHQVIVQLIASTKTQTGLNIDCDIDWNRCPKGLKIPKAALKNLNITYDQFHPDWNYTLSPATP